MRKWKYQDFLARGLSHNMRDCVTFIHINIFLQYAIEAITLRFVLGWKGQYL